MFFVLRETVVPLLSLFIFLLGAGFFSTLLALKMTLNLASPMMIGAVTAFFYAGLVLGSFRADRFILRVGHIRAYTVYAASLAVICFLHGIFYHVGFWLLLRFLGGFVSAGVFVVIESWLLCVSNKQNRGQVMSLYMISFYGAQSLGQFFLNLGDPQTLLLFALTAMLCTLSIIPLCLSYVSPPNYTELSTLSLKKAITASPGGSLGALCSGMIMGGIYGLMPTYLTDLFGSVSDVAKYMFALVFGGMLLQYPLGKLSDLIERRSVLILIAAATIAVSVMVLIAHETPGLFFMLILIFGGLTFALYPVSVSYACDTIETRDLVMATQGLLLAYSVGAMIGPLIAPVFMHFMDDAGLFIYFSAVCGLVIPMFILHGTNKKLIYQSDTP